MAKGRRTVITQDCVAVYQGEELLWQVPNPAGYQALSEELLKVWGFRFPDGANHPTVSVTIQE